MLAMFDDETIRKTYERSIRREEREAGIEQGIRTNMLASLKSIMSNLKLSFDQAATASLGIPAEDRAEYAEMMK